MTTECKQPLQLHLYVAGQTERSRLTIIQLDAVVAMFVDRNTSVTITDLLKSPEAVEKCNILAIPTLIREAPAPRIRIIGDMSDAEKVWLSLNS